MNCEEGLELIRVLDLQEVYDTHWKARKIPIIGTIEITYACNFRCVHCYADNKHSMCHLSFAKIVQLIDQMVDAGTFILTLSGGDPLMHPEFKQIYKYIKERGIFVEIFTNGSLITEDIINLFKEYPPINVDITLYGASEDTYMRVTGNKDGYWKTLQAIDMLRRADIHYTLKTSVMKENADDLPQIQAFAEKCGVNFRYSYQIAPTIEGDIYNYSHRLTPSEVVQREKHDEKRVAYWSAREKVLIADVPYGELPVYNCKTAKFTFCISADGFLSGCIHDRIHTFDLSKGSFIDGWNYINACIDSIKITKDFPCASCEFLPFCNTCPADAERQFHNINCVDSFNCELARLRYITFGKEIR